MMKTIVPPPTAGPRRRRGRWILLGVLGLVLAVIAVEAGRAVAPPEPLRAGPRTVEVAAQQGLFEIAQQLADNGIIRSPLAFVALALTRGTARSLKAGEYEIPRGATLVAVLELLEVGKVKPHLVMVRGGATVRELARQLEAEGLARAPEVLQVAQSAAFAQGLGIEAEGLEGYLFPDTYRVTKGMRIEEILGRMVQRFREKIGTPETLARAREQGLTLHGLVTLASIIEKESGVSEELPIIAGVFWNRLKRDMPLQADPTVAYAVGKDGRAPTREDLQVDHPFNTYRNRGLPPGPIGSPGRAAVDAALAPAPVPYLYFVATDDHRHHFSATLDEHNQAVARYRQVRRPATP
jgi:peptidoglycan lytic transglycosylase G